MLPTKVSVRHSPQGWVEIEISWLLLGDGWNGLDVNAQTGHNFRCGVAYFAL
jgi:hypothetical protein